MDTNDILKIGWLPIKEKKRFSSAQTCVQLALNQSWPTYFKTNKVHQMRLLHLNSAKRLVIPQRGQAQPRPQSPRYPYLAEREKKS